VEHPVTEEITGVDLVEWQLRVASGEALPKRQDELSINGWAMEARLYAEDPAKGFLPTSGSLHYLPDDDAIRVDSGYDWQEIPPFYDPMVAKLIASGRSRERATGYLASALERSVIGPIVTNAQFLLRALRHPEFCAGTIDTGFIDRHLEQLTHSETLGIDGIDYAADYFVGLRFEFDHEFERGNVLHKLRGFRANAPTRATISLSVDGERNEGHYNSTFGNDRTAKLFTYFDGDTVWVNQDGHTHQVALYEPRGSGVGHAHDGDILSPMPGRIIAVEVAAGDTVTKGQKLLTLEAMKMEHSLTAPFDGVVAELNATVGAQVQVDTLLVRIEAAGEA
ncbi:MAG: biotin/lipoyl-containing protein, partial [Pseudomonadota bacterium]